MASNVADVDRVINELKELVGRDWKKVARELRFSRTDIDAIELRERDDLKEQIHLFFEKWKMREGSNAAIQQLVDAVKAAQLQGILDELQRALPGLIQCSEGCVSPVPESSKGDDGHKGDSEREHVRKKRLERLSSSEPDKTHSVPGRGVTRSVSSPSSSSALSKETVSPSGKNATDSLPPAKGDITSPTRTRFEVGHVVKVERKPKRPWYGVIKWIGNLPNVPGLCAGIEMEEPVEGGHSGKHEGKRYFTCEDGYGVILRLSQLKPDDRFDPPSLIRGPTPTGEDTEKDKKMPPASPQSNTSATSPRAEGSSSFTTPKSHMKEEAKMPVVESTDGDTAGATGGSERKLFFVCPGDVAGIIIGKEGKNRKEVESETDTKITVVKDESDTTANTNVLIQGSKENCEKALRLIVQNIRRKTALHTATTDTMMIPNQRLCGRVIGRGGANVRAIQNLTGTRIKVERKEGLEAVLDSDGPRRCEITGSPDQIKKAKELIAMALEGHDVAQAAVTAAFMVRLMKELKVEGFTFPESD